VTDSIIVIKDN